MTPGVGCHPASEHFLVLRLERSVRAYRARRRHFGLEEIAPPVREDGHRLPPNLLA